MVDIGTFLMGAGIAVVVEEYRILRLRLDKVGNILAPLRARIREMIAAHYRDLSGGLVAKQLADLEPEIETALEELRARARPLFAGRLLRAVRDASQHYSQQGNQPDVTRPIRALEALQESVIAVGGATWFDALRFECRKMRCRE